MQQGSAWRRPSRLLASVLHVASSSLACFGIFVRYCRYKAKISGQRKRFAALKPKRAKDRSAAYESTLAVPLHT